MLYGQLIISVVDDLQALTCPVRSFRQFTDATTEHGRS